MGFRSGGQATMTEIAGGSPAARGGSYVPGGEESAQRKEVTDSAGARRARSGDPADGGGSAPSPAPAKKKQRGVLTGHIDAVTAVAISPTAPGSPLPAPTARCGCGSR